MNAVKIKIPFGGFYGSIHDDAIGRAEEIYSTDDNDNPININVNYRETMKIYAEKYTDKVNELFADIAENVFSFVELKSPREYNFATDEIIVNINKDDLQKLFALCDNQDFAKNLQETVKEELTARSGFIPFYPNDIDDWGKPEEWDSAQIDLFIMVCMQWFIALETNYNDINDWEYNISDYIDVCEFLVYE